MYRQLGFILALLLSGLSSCTLGSTIGEQAQIPTPPGETASPAPQSPAPPSTPATPALAMPATSTMSESGVIEPFPGVTHACSSLTPCAPPPSEPPPSAPLKKGKPRSEPSPAQLIQAAQREARVAPTKRGYFGSSGVQRYLWVPGKIYDVYLAPTVGTKIEFPPGEVIAHALILNPKSFDTNMATVGEDVAKNTILFIRPCAEAEPECVRSPDVDVALTSKSGRGYNLHLIIGSIAMLGVTWELTPIPHIEVADPDDIPRRKP